MFGPGSGTAIKEVLAVEEDIRLAYPETPAEPDMAARLMVARELHSHYSAYFGGPETFRLIPRLGADPRIAALERAWLTWEDEQVDSGSLPTTPTDFHDWFIDLAERHVQIEFCHFLATEASLAGIALFIVAEGMVDGRFDDLVALAQIGASHGAKVALAENYWDEMGQGKLDGMHTVLFDRSVGYMRSHLDAISFDVSAVQTAEILENANLAMMYCVHRHLVPRALGALGLMEYSAPPRFQAMVDGCIRLGVPEDVIEYQRVHIHVDADHGAEWMRSVFEPLVTESPEVLREVAVGVATRMRVANAYYQCIWELMRNVQS